MDGQQQRLFSIFHPFAVGRAKKLVDGKVHLAHYTTAEKAFKVLTNREIWLRNTSLMNDLVEIRHGDRCLDAVRAGITGMQLEEAIEIMHPGLWQQVCAEFDEDGLSAIYELTHIACLSEYDEQRLPLGRLSMWRAYGGTNGVALLFNGAKVAGDSVTIDMASTPVEYLGIPEFDDAVQQIVRGLQENIDFLKKVERETIRLWLHNMLRFAILATKHPAFDEEQEWRLVHTAGYEAHNSVIGAIELIDGVPQSVIKVPLKNQPDKGVFGMEITDLLEKIVIGPAKHPEMLKASFTTLLKSRGFKDAEDRVEVLDIPLRV